VNSSDGTKKVGDKTPNEIGIFDMSGNVWEWCHDLAGGKHCRGGAWINNAEFCTVSFRDNDGNPTYRDNNIGFRYARTATGDMVIVVGGALPEGSGLAGQNVQAFQIGRTETTLDK
jgi:hypothetical protein